ncbi:MAG: sterol desaturase family protein [Nitrospinae bacterium]|nr:sterol desaturase family protein [Nitrospinota bacterium]
MNEFILEHETLLRVSCFITVFLLVASSEAVFPRRPLNFSKYQRWFSNILIVVIDSAAVKIIFPFVATGAAAIAQQKGWGLFNLTHLPQLFTVIFSVVLLDFVIYLQHIIVHKIPLLWRLHRMHHSDLDYDVTTGTRFHPIEIILSMAIKILTVFILGVPVIAVILFEVILNASAMFNHGNIKLPAVADKIIRSLFVTPDMHRVHHSVIPEETDSNFGFFISVWDKLFGTYKEHPEKGHTDMTIGLELFRNPEELKLSKILLQPFKNS